MVKYVIIPVEKKLLKKWNCWLEVYIIYNSYNLSFGLSEAWTQLTCILMRQLSVCPVFSLRLHELDTMKSLMGMLKTLMQFGSDREKWHLLAIPHSLHPRKIQVSSCPSVYCPSITCASSSAFPQHLNTRGPGLLILYLRDNSIFQLERAPLC